MALYIPHSIFRLARLLYVRPETFGPYYVYKFTHQIFKLNFSFILIDVFHAGTVLRSVSG